jgi:outer membrane protein assembly factor BamB
MNTENKTDVFRRIAVRSLFGISVVAALFCVVMCVLVLGTYLQLKLNDPLASPALTTLYERLRNNPDDENLKEELRSLDLLARKAYFTSRSQVTLGGIFLGIGAAVFFLSFVGRELLKKTLPPSPKGKPVPETLVVRLFSRRLVAGAAAGLFGVSVLLVVIGLPLFDSLSGTLASTQAASTPQAAADSQGNANASAQNTEKTDVKDASSPAINMTEFLASWPHFRGPLGNSIAKPGSWPTSWDGVNGIGILWKRPIPKQGFNSPVVYGKRVFLSGADRLGADIYCFDALSGAPVFTTKVDYSVNAANVKVEVQVGFAAPSLAVNGVNVAALFATGDLVCLDMKGAVVWKKSLGIPVLNYGFGSSLMTTGDLLIVQYDQKSGPMLYAFVFATGETRWQVKRDVLSSWATPTIAQSGGKKAIVLSANPFVSAYDAATGSELWSTDLFTGEIGSSPVYADGIVYAGNATARLGALKSDDGSLLWEYYEDLPDVSSPVVTGGLLFMASSGAVVTCLDAKTGELLWKEEFTDGFYATPVVAGDRVYLLDREGVMHTVAVKRTYTHLDASTLGEQADATPAFYDNKIYIRGKKNLFCIGK